MKYLYHATFSDGSTFSQPADDESRLSPGEKSSKHDFIRHWERRVLETFVLSGDGHVVIVDHQRKQFLIDGIVVRPGDHLPHGFEWVEADPLQDVYYRRVTIVRDGEETTTDVQFCVGIKAEPGVRNYIGAR